MKRFALAIGLLGLSALGGCGLLIPLAIVAVETAGPQLVDRAVVDAMAPAASPAAAAPPTPAAALPIAPKP